MRPAGCARRLAAAVVALLLALPGCAARPRPITLPDGRRGYAVSCGPVAACQREAHRICPAGHVLIDATNSGPDPAKPIRWAIRCR